LIDYATKIGHSLVLANKLYTFVVLAMLIVIFT